jgi:N-acetylmuramoyl-L-alanine amidase
MKKLIFAALVCLTILMSSYTTGKKYYTVKTVVIDAGHGGGDPGTLGTRSLKSSEKDVALGVALRIGEYIKANYPDLKVIYTRRSDKFIELHERAAIANRANADCFISVHCNSAAPSATGTETYAMGTHKTESNLSVAKRENSSILLESDYTENYDGFDPKSAEAHIMFSMFQNAYMAQSLLLAQKVENQMAATAKRKSRGVRQAGFLVLYRTTMPAILIETGFLTNTTEEKYLHSDEGQDNIALSVYKAFSDYKQQIEAAN